MAQLRCFFRYFLSFVFFVNSIAAFANAGNTDALLNKLKAFYQSVYGEKSGSIKVREQTINGVTTYHTAINVCEDGSKDCRNVLKKTFRETNGFMYADGQYYAVRTVDGLDGLYDVYSNQNQSLEKPPRRIDFSVGYGSASQETGEVDFARMVKIRMNPDFNKARDLDKYLPAIRDVIFDSYKDLQNSLQTSLVMHQAYVNNLNALGQIGNLFEISAKETAAESQKREALLALSMGDFALKLGGSGQGAENLKEIQEFEQIKNSSDTFRQYDLTEYAEAELLKKAQQAFTARNVRALADAIEIGVNQRNASSRARFSSKMGGVIDDGLIQVSVVNPQVERSPLEQRRFIAPIASPAGQALRRAGNLAQVLWSEQRGYSKATTQARTLYTTALVTLSAAEEAFRKGRMSEGYGAIHLATQLLNGSVGFTKGLYRAGEDLVKSLPALSKAAVELADAVVNDPQSVYEGAANLIIQTPTILEAIAISAVCYGDRFIHGDTETKGEILGRISGEIILGIATGGVAEYAVGAVRGVAIGSKSINTLRGVSKLGESESYFANALTQSIASVEPKVTQYTEVLRAGAERLAIKSPEKFESFLESFAKSDLKMVEHAGKISEGIAISPVAKKIFDQTPVNRPAFYVKPNGEAIPSTAYRHLDSKSIVIENILRDGVIPPHDRGGNYITFQKFDSFTDAKEMLQLPNRNDAVYRVTIDTLENINDLEIPKGIWGKADWLEPITRDFPEYGIGGATQAITNKAMPGVLEVKNLKTGEILFKR